MKVRDYSCPQADTNLPQVNPQQKLVLVLVLKGKLSKVTY